MMKIIKSIFAIMMTIALLSTTIDATAQTKETLLKGKKVTFSGFGGPLMLFAKLNNQAVIGIGGKGAALVNDQFVFGGFGYGSVVNLTDKRTGSGDKYRFGEGGLWLGYIYQPYKLVHTSFNLYSSWITMRKNDEINMQSPDGIYYSITPFVDAELNMTNYFKIKAGLGYKYVVEVNGMDAFKAEDLAGPTIMIGFMFGRF